MEIQVYHLLECFDEAEEIVAWDEEYCKIGKPIKILTKSFAELHKSDLRDV